MEGATERLVAGLRARPRALVLVSAVVVAVVTWLVLWSTVQPRAEWDSLIYHRLAFQYAGASEDRQIRDSFTIFERYAGAARRAAGATGAITLLVSHRFSTVRMADLILVVDGNGIAEAGSHDELMRLGGIYAELYELQARAYR